MKISYQWLKQYVRTAPDPADVSAILTGCGLEVENVEPWSSVKGGLKGVVIGEVLTCKKHPDSDHLSLTTVNIGTGDPLKIVCGAPNVAEGQKVAVATIGTTLYFNDKEIVIKKSKIRGEVSEGMICAEDELGLGNSHAGIMVLDAGATVGMSARDYFRVESDTIFEIGLTPNRPDAASHLGVARDLSAVRRSNALRQGENMPEGFIFPDVSQFREGHGGRKISIEIIDKIGCPRYTGLTMTGVHVGESPAWLKNRLLAIGQRPINSIVDITNFVLHETGQPLHAFDADQIRGDKVVIKKATEGEKFITLDEVERTLSGNDLMICNAEEPMVIAGVFGGLHSGVTAETKNIFLESACFDPKTIRKTSKLHSLQTDASFRFERGADINMTVYALKRAALLVREIAGGEPSSEIVDAYPTAKAERTVVLKYPHLDRLAGMKLEKNIVRQILGDLGISIISEDDEKMELRIPSYKVDVHREADVIEEILRIYGYNNIDFSNAIRSALSFVPKPDPDKLRNVVSDWLSNNGFYEIYNNSLTKSAYYEGNELYGIETAVPIYNPLSRDLNVMRQTLLYGGLESLVYNQNRKISDIKLYEFGNIYRKDKASKENDDPLGKYHEETHLAILLTGQEKPVTWNAPGRNVDFYDLKGIVRMLLFKAGFPAGDLTEEAWQSPEIREGVAYKYKGEIIVILGYLTSAVLKKFDCRQDVLYADIHWDNLIKNYPVTVPEVTELPRYPEVRRDMALLLDENVPFSKIESTAFATEKKLLRKVSLFDVYEGKEIGQGKKSYAVSFILGDESRTLTDPEIDAVMEKFANAFKEKLGAQIR